MNTLTYQDLNDFYREETKGYNFETSVGGDKTDQKETNLHPQGTTTIGGIHSSYEKEQITRATIENGNITIANNSDISNLKRDVNKSQEITKDIITGALNGSVSIDNRLFTPGGLVSIYSNAKNLAGNTFMAVGGALSDTKLVLDTSADILGAIPGSLVWVSRKLTEETGIPPHPFPSFGIGDEVMGESSFRRDGNNKPIPDEGTLNVYTQKTNDPIVSDRNILFRFLYAYVPTAKAATDEHDVKMSNLQKEGVKLTGNKKYEVPSSTLKKTILPSFLETFYGIPGTILDFKNYGENYRKIKDSYNNGIPRNRTIIRDTSGKTIYNDSWRLKSDKK